MCEKNENDVKKADSTLSVVNDEGTISVDVVKRSSTPIVMDFDDKLGSITIEAIHYNEFGGNTRSVSKVIPVGRNILVAEYGTVDMLAVLNHINNNQPLKASAKMMIVGLGNEVPEYIKVGHKFYPKLRDSHLIRPIFDPQNDYSFERIADKASKDKTMLAAVAIAGSKERSKVGLRINYDNIDPNSIERLEGKRNYGDMLYKGNILQFVNYHMMDYTNIDAIII